MHIAALRLHCRLSEQNQKVGSGRRAVRCARQYHFHCRGLGRACDERWASYAITRDALDALVSILLVGTAVRSAKDEKLDAIDGVRPPTRARSPARVGPPHRSHRTDVHGRTHRGAGLNVSTCEHFCVAKRLILSGHTGYDDNTSTFHRPLLRRRSLSLSCLTGVRPRMGLSLVASRRTPLGVGQRRGTRPSHTPRTTSPARPGQRSTSGSLCPPLVWLAFCTGTYPLVHRCPRRWSHKQLHL